MPLLQLPYCEEGPPSHLPKFSILKAFSMGKACPGELGGAGAVSELVLLQQHRPCTPVRHNRPLTLTWDSSRGLLPWEGEARPGGSHWVVPVGMCQ